MIEMYNSVANTARNTPKEPEKPEPTLFDGW